MKGACYVLLQGFVVLLGLGAVACVVFCYIRRFWLEAMVAGVLALLCIHVCILQAERNQLERKMEHVVTLGTEEIAKTRGAGLELAEEGAAGHHERPSAKDGHPVRSVVSPAAVHSPLDKVHVVADQHTVLGKALADDGQQKDLDKAMLNALAQEYLRCSTALQDYRKRYGLLDGQDGGRDVKRTNERRKLAEQFRVDPASDVSMQRIGDLKNMASEYSGARADLARTPNRAMPASRRGSVAQDDRPTERRPPATLIGGCDVSQGHVPDMVDRQARHGWVGAAGNSYGDGRGDNGAGVIQLLPNSPRGGPPARPVVRRRQPGQSRQGPPTVTLAAREQTRFSDNRPGNSGPGLV